LFLFVENLVKRRFQGPSIERLKNRRLDEGSTEYWTMEPPRIGRGRGTADWTGFWLREYLVVGFLGFGVGVAGCGVGEV
jgi:hypothetical protein